jgi:DNA-binding response OmpR family regulator
MRILIAEDDGTSRAMLALVLKKVGHDVVAAADGAEAWRLLQEPDAPLIAILDWMMPGLSGPDLVRMIRARGVGPRPYLILLTTKTDPADMAMALAAGADDYVAKPFDPHELRARVMTAARTLGLA